MLRTEKEILSPSLLPSSLVVGRKVVLSWVIREGDLSLPLICYSTSESLPCISPGQHNRAVPASWGLCEPAPRAAGELALPLTSYQLPHGSALSMASDVMQVEKDSSSLVGWPLGI